MRGQALMDEITCRSGHTPRHSPAHARTCPRLIRAPPPLILLTVLTALSALTLNLVPPSLPSMARVLAARVSVTALAVSGYMSASALFQRGLGPVSDRIGRRPLMRGALLLFMAASPGHMLTPKVTVKIAHRVLHRP